MNVLQNQFLKTFLRNFGLVLVALLVINTLFMVLNNLGQESTTYQSSFRFWSELVLVVAESVLPLSLLVAALFSVAPMSHFNELSAIGSSGQSIFQVIWPALVLSFVAVLYSLALRHYGIVGAPGGLGGENPGFISGAEQATTFHSNLAYPWSNLLAFLGGVFVAGSPRKRSMFSGFILAVVGLFFYYTVSSFYCSFGNKGLLHPILAGWGGTVVFSVVLVFQWRKMTHK